MTHPELLMADWHGDDLRREAAAWRLAGEAVRARRGAQAQRASLRSTLTTALAATVGAGVTRARLLGRAVPSGPQPCGC